MHYSFAFSNQRWVWRGVDKCVTVRYLGSMGGGNTMKHGITLLMYTPITVILYNISK